MVLYDENGIQVKVNGEVDLEILLDVGFSYGLFAGLEDFKFIPKVTSREYLEVSITGKISDVWDKEIASISFGKLSFFIGPVPVWLTFNLDISLGAEATVEASVTTDVEFNQMVKAGLSYNNDKGFEKVLDFSKSWVFNPPQLDASLTVKGYLKPAGSILIYSATGPKITIEPSLELRGDFLEEGKVVDSCTGGIHFSSWFILKSDFSWDFSGDTKIGQLLHLDELEEHSTFNIIEKEWPIYQWHWGGTCGQTKPHLRVIGDNICAP